MKPRRDSSAGNGGSKSSIPSIVRNQVSSETHWWTMCSSGVRARSAHRKRRSSSRNVDHVASVFSRSVSYVSRKNHHGLESGTSPPGDLWSHLSRAGRERFRLRVHVLQELLVRLRVAHLGDQELHRF